MLVERDRALLNIYSVMEVNPANGPRINSIGGKAFADFMVAPETQVVIRNFGVEKFGQSLFLPVAGKSMEAMIRFWVLRDLDSPTLLGIASSFSLRCKRVGGRSRSNCQHSLVKKRHDGEFQKHQSDRPADCLYEAIL